MAFGPETLHGTYLFHNGNSRGMCGSCSKLTINTPERHLYLLKTPENQRLSGVLRRYKRRRSGV